MKKGPLLNLGEMSWTRTHARHGAPRAKNRENRRFTRSTKPETPNIDRGLAHIVGQKHQTVFPFDLFLALQQGVIESPPPKMACRHLYFGPVVEHAQTVGLVGGLVEAALDVTVVSGAVCHGSRCDWFAAAKIAGSADAESGEEAFFHNLCRCWHSCQQSLAHEAEQMCSALHQSSRAAISVAGEDANNGRTAGTTAEKQMVLSEKETQYFLSFVKFSLKFPSPLFSPKTFFSPLPQFF